MNSFILTVQGMASGFSSIFIVVYLLGLRDLPETVVYHSDPTFRTILSVFGVLSLLLMSIAIILSFIAKSKD
jgi:hypothetical protein